MIGGVANYYYNLFGKWPETEKIHILDNSDKKLIDPFFWPFKWLPSIWNVKKEAKRNKIDHIFVGQILPLGIAAFLVKKISSLKYSVFIHGMDYSFAQRTKRKKYLSNLILSSASNIICSNAFVADLISKDDPKLLAKIIIANPGVSAPSALENFKLDDFAPNLTNKKYILTIARLVKRKGIDNMIMAMEKILPKHDDVVYLIAGTGPDEEYLKGMAANLKDKIIFLGQISDAQKWFLLSRCDIFAMPSRNIQGDFEGFGIVYLEANLFGKPVIAGNEGGEYDAVKNGYSGLLVDPRNIDQIADAAGKLLLDHDLCGKLGANGKKRALEKFNWEIIAVNLLKSIKI